MARFASEAVMEQRYRVIATLEENDACKLLYVQDRLREENFAARVIPQIDRVQDETRREFQRLQQVVHPSVARVIDFGESEVSTFYTRELIGELSLKEALQAGEHKPDPFACLVEAALALEALHEGGCVHGMVQSNFIRLASGERIAGVHLVDAGLRNLLPKGYIASLGLNDAPETRAEGATSPASDIYQLGAAFMEALVGSASLKEQDRYFLEFLESLQASKPRQRPGNGKELVRALRSADWILSDRQRDARSLLSAALVGRERTVSLLDNHLVHASEGSIHAVEIVGESGTGRSRILREFGSKAGAQGWTIIDLQTSGQQVSYASLLQALRQSRGHRRAVETREEELGVGPLVQIDSEPDETRLWAAMAQQVLRLVKQSALKPLILIDDVDDAPRDLQMVLRHVITEVGDDTLLVAATSRGGKELPGGATVILEFLNERDLRRLCAPLLAESLNPDVTLAVLQKTWAGRPLWVHLHLMAWLESGQLRFVGGRPFFDEKRPGHSPGTIAEAIQAAMAAMDEETRDAFELLAVWGRSVPKSLAERLLSRKIESDLLRLEGDALRFASDSIGPIIRESMVPNRRQGWHRQILERVPSTELSGEERARHLRGAGELAEAAREFIAAAKERKEKGAYVTACELFREGIECLEKGKGDLQDIVLGVRLGVIVGELNWARVTLDAYSAEFEARKQTQVSLYVEFLLLRANVLRGLRHAEEAAPLYEEARSIAEQSPDLRHRASEIALEESANDAFLGEPEQGLRRIEPILKGAKAQSLPLLALTYKRLGMLHALRGASETAASYELRCARLARKLGDDQLAARALATLGGLYHLLNRSRSALRALDRAERLLRHSPNDNVMAAILVNRSGILLKLGKAEQAEGALLRAKAIRERSGLVSGVPNILIGLGNIHRKSGNLSMAARLFQEAIVLAEEFELPAVHVARADLGDLFLHQGQHEAAKDLLRKALANPRSDHRGIVLVNLGRLFRQRGQLPEAWRTLEEGENLLLKYLPAAEPFAVIEEARVLLDARDLDGCAFRLQTVRNELGTDEQRAEYHLAEGLLAHARGVSAEEAFNSAIAAADRVGDPTLLGEILVQAMTKALEAPRCSAQWIMTHMNLLASTVKHTDADPVLTRFEALEGILAKQRSSFTSAGELSERVRKKILEERKQTVAPPLGDLVQDLEAAGALVFVVGLEPDGQARLSPVATPAMDDPSKIRPYRAAARAFDRKIFGEALAAAEGNVVEAARLLGMPSSTFRYQAEKLKLIKPVRRDG